MKPRVYYNEKNLSAARWLRNLIKKGRIAPGHVDTRSITEVRPKDLEGYSQCHFFAGIGAWSLALRNAGWPDDRPVWTGSCPCQPFSITGHHGGFDDERHLWPYFRDLITERGPRAVFGEQVASKSGLGWLDNVQADLEAAGYASAAVDLCAAGFGAPHVRQRLYWVAERLGDTTGEGLEGHGARTAAPGGRQEPARHPAEAGVAVEEGVDGPAALQITRAGTVVPPTGRTATSGFWADADWYHYTDGCTRPSQPGTFPLAHGTARRVERLCGLGNSLVEPVAREFIKAYIESET